MKNLRYSYHKIYHKEECTFNKADYSRFKFGDTRYARKFAEELFMGLISEYENLILEQHEIVLLPSPYHSIPTASNFLCHYFKENLNKFLFNKGKKACVEGKIYRNQTYVQDYGSLDYEQRINLIANDTYHIDKHFVENRFCIFLDDIKITGSHEQTINRILDYYKVSGKFLFVYYAELMNKEIHPSIENHYNYFQVKTVYDIVEVLNSQDFRFNTRIVKYILLMSSDEFDFVLRYIPYHQQQKLLDLAISNNYHQIDEYQMNIKHLNNKLWQSTYKKDKEKVSMLQNLPLV